MSQETLFDEKTAALETLDRIITSDALICDECGTHAIYSTQTKEFKKLSYTRLRDRIWAFLTLEPAEYYETNIETVSCGNGHTVSQYETYAWDRPHKIYEKSLEDAEVAREIYREFLNQHIPVEGHEWS